MLSKPYPFLYSTKKNFAIALFIGLFILVFNYILNDNQSVQQHLLVSRFAIATLFGLITFLSILLMFELLPRLFFIAETKENWTIGKEFLLIAALISLIILCNYTTLFFVAKNQELILSIKHFLIVCIQGLLIGLIPTFFMVWLNYTIILRKNLKQAQYYNTQLKAKLNTPSPSSANTIIHIPSNNLKETIHLDTSQLLFIKSEGNYIEVYCKKNQQIEKNIYRASLKNIEDKLSSFSYIMRVHRSYIVNLHKIEQTKGNARNYELFFSATSFRVPVARSKFKEFTQKLLANS